MIRLFLLSFGLFALTACATAMDGGTQVVSIETPGASGGICYLERRGYKQRVWVPRQVHIPKASDPLHLTCLAPGNRIVKKTVEAQVNDKTFLNIANLGLGAPVDYESGAMFKLPETIVVDFSGLEYARMEQPDYDTLLREHPELAGLEEFRPGQAMLLRDINATSPELTARRSASELYSDQGLSELRAPDQAVYMRPDVVGTGGIPALDDSVSVGGQPVIGGRAADDLGTPLPEGIEPLSK